MIPLRDNIPSRTIPVVNYAMIGICAVVFLFQALEPEDAPSLVEKYGMIPVRVLHPDRTIEHLERVVVQTRRGYVIEERPRVLADSAVPPWLTPLTCVFLHGGWLHVLGNLWFLYIFGDNVEDRLGHLGYLVFYLAGGVAASLVHLLTNMSSEVPTIGASGAIAAVMGAYLISYPHAKVLSLIPIIIFYQVVVLPAPLFLGIWFVLQFFQGVMSIGGTESAGVAWWAHIGGFAMGVAVMGLLSKLHVAREPVHSIRPHTDHVTAYRVYPRRPPW
jgi:membrane associated rhomboid family serine protease